MASTTIPPLENGDKLTRSEFELRYDNMPKLKKAELIEGIVYIPHSALQFVALIDYDKGDILMPSQTKK